MDHDRPPDPPTSDDSRAAARKRRNRRWNSIMYAIVFVCVLVVMWAGIT